MRLKELLARLAEHGVRFSVIGGVALIARGVQRATADLDIATPRAAFNALSSPPRIVELEEQVCGDDFQLLVLFEETLALLHRRLDGGRGEGRAVTCAPSTEGPLVDSLPPADDVDLRSLAHFTKKLEDGCGRERRRHSRGEES